MPKRPAGIRLGDRVTAVTYDDEVITGTLTSYDETNWTATVNCDGTEHNVQPGKLLPTDTKGRTVII